MLLNEFRSQAQGLPDLLPWAALIDNGVVLTKSGGLLAGLNFVGQTWTVPPKRNWRPCRLASMRPWLLMMAGV